MRSRVSRKSADVGDPALEQVADAAPAGQQLHCVLGLDVRGEHQDGDVGEFVADHLRGV